MILKRKLYTANEEIGFKVVPIVIFVGVWYGFLIRSFIADGFIVGLIPHYIAGLVVAFFTGRNVRRALIQRLRHREIMKTVQPLQGRILDIKLKQTRRDSGKRVRIISWYYLEVQVTDPNTGFVRNVISDPYHFPPQRYLASPIVDVYIDESGWHPVIDGFQLKQRRSEPDIPLMSASSYLNGSSKIFLVLNIFLWIFFALVALKAMGIF